MDAYLNKMPYTNLNAFQTANSYIQLPVKTCGGKYSTSSYICISLLDLIIPKSHYLTVSTVFNSSV